MSCPTGAWELPCSAYYITEIQRKKLVKNETNFRRELLFQSPGSHASFFPPVRVYFYLLYLSIHLFFFCTCLPFSPSFYLWHLFSISLFFLLFIVPFFITLLPSFIPLSFPSSSFSTYTPHSSFPVSLSLYLLLHILSSLPLLFLILPVFVVPSCSPPAALVVLNARWLGAAGRMAAVLP